MVGQPVVPGFGKLRQESHDFMSSLGFVAGPCFKKKDTYLTSISADVELCFI
jgi:hypothetical protein